MENSEAAPSSQFLDIPNKTVESKSQINSKKKQDANSKIKKRAEADWMDSDSEFSNANSEEDNERVPEIAIVKKTPFRTIKRRKGPVLHFTKNYRKLRRIENVRKSTGLEQCTECGFRFTNAQQLDVHVRKKHKSKFNIT